jgi:hypothetical protein
MSLAVYVASVQTIVMRSGFCTSVHLNEEIQATIVSLISMSTAAARGYRKYGPPVMKLWDLHLIHFGDAYSFLDLVRFDSLSLWSRKAMYPSLSVLAESFGIACI